MASTDLASETLTMFPSAIESTCAINGASGRIRISNLQGRSLLLYPIELQRHKKNGTRREFRNPDILNVNQALCL